MRKLRVVWNQCPSRRQLSTMLLWVAFVGMRTYCTSSRTVPTHSDVAFKFRRMAACPQLISVYTCHPTNRTPVPFLCIQWMSEFHKLRQSVYTMHQLLAIVPWFESAAQPALHFGGGNFHEISFDDVIVLIQPWYNFFADGHIYNNGVFLPADTKSIVQTHTFCTTLVNKNRQKITFYNSVGGWITGVKRNFWLQAVCACTEQHSTYQHAEKTDD